MPFVITNPEEDQPEEEQLSMPSQQQSNLPEQDGQFVITEEEQEEIPQQQGFEFQTAGDIAQNITRPGNIGIKDFIGGFLQTAMSAFGGGEDDFVKAQEQIKLRGKKEEYDQQVEELRQQGASQEEIDEQVGKRPDVITIGEGLDMLTGGKLIPTNEIERYASSIGKGGGEFLAGQALFPGAKTIQSGVKAAGSGALFGTGQQVAEEAGGGEKSKLAAGIGFASLPFLLKKGRAPLLNVLNRGESGVINKVKNLINRRISPSQLAEETIQKAGRVSEEISGVKPDVFENIINELSQEEAKQLKDLIQKAEQQTSLAGIKPTSPQKAATTDLTKRKITPTSKDIGLRPVPTKPIAERPLNERIADKVYNKEIYSDTETGKALKNIVRELDVKEYRNINKLYEKAKNSNAQVSDIRPDLISSLEEKLSVLENIPKPSSVQEQLKNTIKKIISFGAEKGPNDQITGYKPISNNQLIDQIQSIRQTMDFDFAHGKPKNIFKPLIGDLKESISFTAEISGNKKAVDSLKEADSAYRSWSEKFNNDYINPYRDRSNADFSKLGKNLANKDEFNMMKKIIGETQEGKELLGATQREIVEKELKEIFKDPKNISQRVLDRKYRELEAVLSPDQLNAVKNEVVKAQKSTTKPLRVVKFPEKTSVDMKAVQKYTGKSREEVKKLLSTKDGIRELKTDLSKTENGNKLFQKASKEKVRDILYGDKVIPDFTGTDIYNRVNQRKNYELIEELTSPQEAKELLDVSKKIADRKFTMENVKKVGKIFSGHKLFKFLLSV